MVVPVNELSQTLSDVKDDKVFTARFIGPTTPNLSRITVHSALTRFNDKQDTYRIVSTRKTDQLSLTVKTSAPLKFELLDKKGKVIADSTAKDGLLKENYDDLSVGKFKADVGNYYLRVSRPEGTPKTAAVEYYAQFTNGKYTTDYDTEETPPPQDTIQLSAAAQGSINALSQISSLSVSVLSGDNFFSQMNSAFSKALDPNSIAGSTSSSTSALATTLNLTI